MFYLRNSKISIKAMLAYPVIVISGFKLFPVDHSGPRIFFIFMAVAAGFMIWLTLFNLYYGIKDYAQKTNRRFTPNITAFEKDDSSLDDNTFAARHRAQSTDVQSTVTQPTVEKTSIENPEFQTEAPKSEAATQGVASLPPLEFKSSIDQENKS